VTFLLDANVFLDFQNAALLPALVRAAQVIDLAVAEKVFDEVTLPRADDSGDLVGKKRQAERALRDARITKIEIIPGTREAELMQALLAPLKTIKEKDHGEAASIAIAASNADLLFVTGDETAVLWALNELFHKGERVMRVPIFVRTLLERAALDAETVKGVAARAVSHGAEPSWWASWVAAL
jgi:hypothetical protein